ncbi:MAG: response regulator [Desulfobulbaceae bacterium]|nr:response regulator [Desulfobulbaceae bacterium]
MAKAKVMVVDDSPTELRMILEALKDQGYDISTAVDGEEALEKALEVLPQAMVLDIILPKKNGFQVCRQLKTSPETKDIKIILLSSKSQDSDRFWGLKQGADAYMTKPFDFDELRKAVDSML